MCESLVSGFTKPFDGLGSVDLHPFTEGIHLAKVALCCRVSGVDPVFEPAGA